MNYIDWAVEQGFAVIDVNVPKHLTSIDVRSVSTGTCLGRTNTEAG